MLNENTVAAVEDLHRLYCQLTGQHLSLRYDRQRLWFEFLRAGFDADALQRVVRYLQKQIRAGRRNVGALKLSNLLQLDRFEEDLNLIKIRLQPPPSRPPKNNNPPPLSHAEEQRLRQEATAALRRFREQLRRS